jgi:ferric-dicitrate binding protein FerR (iron transport regulator)
VPADVLHFFCTRKPQDHPRADITFDELMAELNLPQPMLRVLPNEPLQPPSPFAVAGLVLGSTAAVVVSVTALFTLALHSGAPGRLISTGADESTSAQFADGSVVWLGDNAAVRVNITEQQRSAHVIGGEFVITVPDLAADFWLDTPVAPMRIAEAATFRLVVSAVSFDLDVYEGVVELYEQGLSPEAPVRQIREKQSYHKAVNATADVVAVPAGGVNDRSDG